MNNILNIARAFDKIILLILYFSYFFTLNSDFLIFTLGFIFNNRLNYILKYYIFEKIYGKNNIPLLGKGIRPNGAKNCCNFAPCNPLKPKSYGMPSGHSQSVAYFSTLGIMLLLDNKKNNNVINILCSLILICLTIFIMYSRILFKCHSGMQTFIGALIGIILGLLLYKYKNKIKNNLNLHDNNDNNDINDNNNEIYILIITTIIILTIL
tara:strand:- start:10477 stop:11106 length:630 start_codon:yes stop_codon:yes gene_type:complete